MKLPPENRFRIQTVRRRSTRRASPVIDRFAKLCLSRLNLLRRKISLASEYDPFTGKSWSRGIETDSDPRLVAFNYDFFPNVAVKRAGEVFTQSTRDVYRMKRGTRPITLDASMRILLASLN